MTNLHKFLLRRGARWSGRTGLPLLILFWLDWLWTGKTRRHGGKTGKKPDGRQHSLPYQTWLPVRSFPTNLYIFYKNVKLFCFIITAKSDKFFWWTSQQTFRSWSRALTGSLPGCEEIRPEGAVICPEGTVSGFQDPLPLCCLVRTTRPGTILSNLFSRSTKEASQTACPLQKGSPAGQVVLQDLEP